MQKNNLHQLMLVLAIVMSACGGSNSPTATFAPTPSVTEPTWMAGQFANAAEFKDRCATPRTEPDSNGDTFSDVQGTAMHEKMWLRSWTNETYLWYSEVEDNNPQAFTVADYFSQLKTNQRTASGTLKDNFHFSQSTEQYNLRTQSGVSSGYGISWEFVRSSTPRQLIVRYTEPNSAARTAGVSRGLELKSIDGIDFVNSSSSAQVDRINAALFPEESGNSVNFVFTNSQGVEVLDVNLASANIELQPVQNVSILDTATGTLGYLSFNSFIRSGQTGLIDGFEYFAEQGITELVIDLRYNGGGLLAMASQLAYMVAGSARTNNQTFETLQFNDKNPQRDPVSGSVIEPTPFYNREINWTTNQFTNNTLPSVELDRVYILTTEGTCSASEAVINGLRGIDVEVVLIGDTTCGKPYGFYPTDNCSTTYFTIQFQGVNAKGFGEYADGFKPVTTPVFQDQLPGCVVLDDFSQPLGNNKEALLAAAIHYSETSTCPIQTQRSGSKESKRSAVTEKSTTAIKKPDYQFESMAIYTPITEPDEQ